MIWLRRALAILLALIFIMLTIPILVIFRVNSTVGNPSFYINQLRQANIYNFIYDDVLPAALGEFKTDDSNLDGFVSQLKPHITPMVKEALPPEWIQTQVEQVISQGLPYVLGDTDGFNINIPLKERVRAGAQAVKNTLHKEGFFPDLYDQAVNSVLNEAAPALQGLPLSRDELKKAATAVLSANWLLTQIDSALDAVTPYLTSDQEHFTIQVDISSRLNDLEAVVTEILKKPETYDYLFENMLAPFLKQNIQNMQIHSPTSIFLIPVDIALTDGEITGVAKEVLPIEWYQVQVVDVTSQIFSYLKGTRQTLEVVVPLADRKPVLSSALTTLVNFKAGIDISILSSPIISGLLNEMPDQWTLNEAGLRQLLGDTGGEDMLRKVREWVQNGLTFTDTDLHNSMGADYKTIEDIRQRTLGGFVFTEKGLTELIGGSSSNASSELQNLEDMRRLLGMLRKFLILVWLIPALILLAIGALGGRTWGSKLIWAASVLGITALITYALFGPVFSSLAEPYISQALAQAVSETQGFSALIMGKGASMAQSATHSFINGLKLQALFLIMVSIILIVLGSIWHKSRAS